MNDVKREQMEDVYPEDIRGVAGGLDDLGRAERSAMPSGLVDRVASATKPGVAGRIGGPVDASRSWLVRGAGALAAAAAVAVTVGVLWPDGGAMVGGEMAGSNAGEGTGEGMGEGMGDGMGDGLSTVASVEAEAYSDYQMVAALFDEGFGRGFDEDIESVASEAESLRASVDSGLAEFASDDGWSWLIGSESEGAG